MNKRNKQGQREGCWEDFYDNGQLIYKGNFINGKKEGYWEHYLPSGEVGIETGTYKNDKKISD